MMGEGMPPPEDFREPTPEECADLERFMATLGPPPARDWPGIKKEVQAFHDGLMRELASDNDAPCPLLSEFRDFVMELDAGRFQPAGHLGEPFDVKGEFDGLTGKQLVALCALRRNMWVYEDWVSTDVTGKVTAGSFFLRRTQSLA
ncbi:MAG: hypothetical protein H6807_14020 [Planctomycetes bacterium]|nr:hypothetical protein [Planctomycetota bacterium]